MISMGGYVDFNTPIFQKGKNYIGCIFVSQRNLVQNGMGRGRKINFPIPWTLVYELLVAF